MGRFESPLYGKGGKDGFGKLIVIAEAMKGRDHDTLHLSMKGVALAAKDGMLAGGKSGECQRSVIYIEVESRSIILRSAPIFPVNPP